MNLAIMSVGQSSVCPDLNATVNSRYYQKSLGQHRFRPVELFEDLRQEYGEDIRSKEIQKALETIKLIKTNVLKTNFRTERGMLSITDFMPVGSKKRTGAKVGLRKVSADKGRPEVEVGFCPRFNYARNGPKLSLQDEEVRASSKEVEISLRSPVDFTVKDGITRRNRWSQELGLSILLDWERYDDDTFAL